MLLCQGQATDSGEGGAGDVGRNGVESRAVGWIRRHWSGRVSRVA